MRTVVLDLHSYAVSDAMWKAFQDTGGFRPRVSEAPARTAEHCRLFEAFAVVLEVVGRLPAYSLEERLRLRDELRGTCPACKVVLIVDEKAEREIAEKCREAMRKKEIDLFVYGSASVNHLISLLDVL